jgi:exodeoxyribonuclease VII small subunit
MSQTLFDSAPETPETPGKDTPSFRAAMDELEGILERIEGEEVDIDRLAEELRRAAWLLELCRGKIRKAEVEVTQIVQSLERDEDE